MLAKSLGFNELFNELFIEVDWSHAISVCKIAFVRNRAVGNEIKKDRILLMPSFRKIRKLTKINMKAPAAIAITIIFSMSIVVEANVK